MQLLLKILFFAAIILTLPLRLAQAQTNEDTRYLLDFVFLNDGMTLDDRDAYNAQVIPIAARYGITLLASFDPLVITEGDTDLDRVDLWELPSQQALADWGQDADYRALNTEVERVHDMENLTLYLAEPIMTPVLASDVVYHLELLTWDNATFSIGQFSDYVSKVDEISQSHEIIRVASLGVQNRLVGSGPEGADWFNLYAVPGPDEYSAMGNDPAYRALDPDRVTLFETELDWMGAFIVQ